MQPAGEALIEALQFLLIALLVGDIALNRDQVRAASTGIDQRSDTQLRPVLSTILAVIEYSQSQWLLALEIGADFVERGSVGVWPLQKARVAPERLGASVASLPLKSVIDVDDLRPRLIDGVGFGDDDRIVGVLEGGRQQLEVTLRPML